MHCVVYCCKVASLCMCFEFYIYVNVYRIVQRKLNALTSIVQCTCTNWWISFFSTTVQNIVCSDKYLVSRAQVIFEMHAETHVGFHIECPLLLSDSNQNLNVLTECSKTPQFQIHWKCFQQFLVACRQTNLVKLIGEFSQFFVENMPKIGTI
jgi:hypothetical protein